MVVWGAENPSTMSRKTECLRWHASGRHNPSLVELFHSYIHLFCSCRRSFFSISDLWVCCFFFISLDDCLFPRHPDGFIYTATLATLMECMNGSSRHQRSAYFFPNQRCTQSTCANVNNKLGDQKPPIFTLSNSWAEMGSYPHPNAPLVKAASVQRVNNNSSSKRAKVSPQKEQRQYINFLAVDVHSVRKYRKVYPSTTRTRPTLMSFLIDSIPCIN